MSKIIASGAIRGAHQIVAKAEEMLKQAIDSHGPNTQVEFPNTAYFLPIIYGLTGHKVEKLSDMEWVITEAKKLLPEIPAEHVWLPYLGPTLDAGIATLFAEELIEALKYVVGPNPVDGIWLGAADDVIMRARGVEFVDGSAPGFAAVVGAAPDNATAAAMAKEMQAKGLYVFIAGQDNGISFADQLEAEGVQLGWDTRLVPFGKEVYAHVYSLGFATRAAMAFGGVEPGDYKHILSYNKNRVFAFVMAMGQVTDEWYATAAGAISYGFPTITTADIPQILPTGVCLYEHVVANVPVDNLIEKAIEVRGVKIQVTEIPIPVAYSPAFEGERIRKEDTFIEFGGQKSPAFELVRMKDIGEVEDNKIEVIGPEVDDLKEPGILPLAIVVDVAGRKMQKDFEPILERQIHHFINGAEGVLHIGQRDIIWLRLSRAAIDKGFKIHHFGDLIRAKMHADFGSIIDKVQVTIYTEEAKVKELLEEARLAYEERDARVAGMTDESVDIYYSCTLCQSFAPNHICMITPQRLGLCGAYNWLDGKASYEINPTGPNQPVEKGATINAEKGQWQGVNEFIYSRSNKAVERFNAYSMVEDPMTSCGCFECIVALMPLAQAVMVVNREYAGMTPSGMKFSTLAGSVGGGQQVPGFIGVGKQYITSPKFISADGGFFRLAWMPKTLKETLMPLLKRRAEELGDPEFVDKIADETIAETEDQVIEYMQKVGHPAAKMDPMF